MKDDFIIQSAAEQAEGVQTASSIMVEAAQWLKNKNEPMWNPEELTPDKLLKAYDLSEIYLGSLENNPALALVFQWKDETFWPKAADDEAGYLHKLSVRREYKGQGLSHKAIAWCKEQCRKNGRKFLRLDCDPNRKGLTKLYENNGFKRVDRRFVESYDTAFYEYRIDII